MDIASIVEKLLAPLRRRVRLMVSRAVISMVNSAGGVQILQVKLLEGEVRDGVEQFQEYGYTSAPPSNAEAVMVCVSGDRDHGIVIAVNHADSRPKDLARGEVAQYDDQGQMIHLKRGKQIHVYGTELVTIDAAAAAVVNSPTCTVNSAEINLGGDRATLLRLVDERVLALLLAHTHKDVQPGTGSSGVMNDALNPVACCTDQTRGK